MTNPLASVVVDNVLVVRFDMSFLLMGQVTSVDPATRRFISGLLKSQAS